jgi:hypothetical protein
MNTRLFSAHNRHDSYHHLECSARTYARTLGAFLSIPFHSFHSSAQLSTAQVVFSFSLKAWQMIPPAIPLGKRPAAVATPVPKSK